MQRNWRAWLFDESNGTQKILAACVLMLVTSYALIIQPMRDALKNTQTHAYQLQAQLKEDQQLLGEQTRIQKQLRQLKSNNPRLKTKKIDEALFNSLAEQNHWEHFKIRTDQNNIDISGQANYPALIYFLKEWHAAKLPFKMDNYHLSARGGAYPLLINIVFTSEPSHEH